MAESDTGGRVWNPAPNTGVVQQTGAIGGVWANPGEEIEWCWVHTPSGSYVNGYTIKPKIFNASEIKKRKKKEHE